MITLVRNGLCFSFVCPCTVTDDVNTQSHFFLSIHGNRIKSLYLLNIKWPGYGGGLFLLALFNFNGLFVYKLW